MAQCPLSVSHSVVAGWVFFAATDMPYYAHSGTTGTDDGYNYYLNVCGRVTIGECGDDEYISSCQVKTSGTMKKVAGRFQNQTLR